GETLRVGARNRLLAAFGLNPDSARDGPDTAPEVLVATVANRTGRSAEEVGTILYGVYRGADETGATLSSAEPEDDKVLVRAVAQLDNLVREVLGGEAI